MGDVIDFRIDDKGREDADVIEWFACRSSASWFPSSSVFGGWGVRYQSSGIVEGHICVTSYGWWWDVNNCLQSGGEMSPMGEGKMCTIVHKLLEGQKIHNCGQNGNHGCQIMWEGKMCPMGHKMTAIVVKSQEGRMSPIGDKMSTMVDEMGTIVPKSCGKAECPQLATKWE